MICPRCGDELRRSKKDPSYGLCDNCRKKYKWVEEEINDELDEDIDVDTYDDVDNDDIDDDVVVVEEEDDDDDDDVYEDIRNPGKSVKRAPKAARKKKKSRGLKFLIILLIILVIALIASYIVFFTDLINLDFNKDKNTQQVQQEETNSTPDEITDTGDDTDTTDKSPNSEGAYESSTYLAGTDLPAGEYVIIADMTGYFERTSDTSGEEGTIIANGNFTTNTIVTVNDGEYLTFSNSVAYPIDQAPALDTTQEGMFKVGKDIEAGEYNIHSDSKGYYEVAADSNHITESIVKNMEFEGDQTVTVEDGQYLTLTSAAIVN